MNSLITHIKPIKQQQRTSPNLKRFGCTLTIAAISLVNLPAQAGLLVKKQAYFHELPESVSQVCLNKNNCPTIELSYIDTNKKWVNQLINQNINTLLAGERDYPSIQMVNDTLKVPASIRQTLDNFANSQIEDMPADTTLSYSKTLSPNYLGHAGSLELFEISGYDYLGGAHGLGFLFYIILDTETQKEVRLDDMLVDNQKDTLRQLLEAKFDKWLIEKQGVTPKDYKAYWQFNLTDNVTFTPKGLSFVYQPYAIASYASGMPELTIPYNQLEGILKPKYQQAGQQLSN